MAVCSILLPMCHLTWSFQLRQTQATSHNSPFNNCECLSPSFLACADVNMDYGRFRLRGRKILACWLALKLCRDFSWLNDYISHKCSTSSDGPPAFLLNQLPPPPSMSISNLSVQTAHHFLPCLKTNWRFEIANRIRALHLCAGPTLLRDRTWTNEYN